VARREMRMVPLVCLCSDYRRSREMRSDDGMEMVMSKLPAVMVRTGKTWSESCLSLIPIDRCSPHRNLFPSLSATQPGPGRCLRFETFT
jgi:hypothetical protein